MSAGTSEFFCLICFLVCSCTALENITAELGQDVILPCKAPNNNKIPITVVEWSRPDQEPENVLFYRGRNFISVNQHPSYKNRVDLQDKELKDRDVSLILKNVMMEDTGTYECLVFQRETNSRKRSILETDPIRSIYLEVHLSGEKSEGAKGDIIRDEENKIGGDQTEISRRHPGVVGVILPLLAVLAFLGFVIYRQHMGQNPNLPVPPDEAAAIEMLPVPEQQQNKPELV